MSRPHASISIVCVYNNLTVREECLDRSIRALAHEAVDIEYLPMDNVQHAYPSAGAALNHGVSLAKNDVIVFAHQDVFLHSLHALHKAAGMLQSGEFGVLGAIGVRSDGRLLGRIRDRVLLAGETVATPTDVDSVDEVLFLAPRAQLLTDPLTESADMAWHAYAVEYGLRMRKKGLRTGVANIPLTHNSLSVNLTRLDEAHRAVAEHYSDLLPVMTTCGTIDSKADATLTRVGWLSGQRWRYRWVRDSMELQRLRSGIHPVTGVLADIRYDVDQLVARAPGQRLYIVNCRDGSPFANEDDAPLELSRHSGDVIFTDCDGSQVMEVVSNLPTGAWVIVTNLSVAIMQRLKRQMPMGNGTLGFHMGTGPWLLIGPLAAELPDRWRSRRATPLGARTLVAAS